MRFLCSLKNAVHYQVKYGFYTLYAFISAVYIAILFMCPGEYKNAVASIVILSDPAMLGTFFIGGIWLLEKREGLHEFWLISPLRTAEYVLSAAVSLSVVSTLSAGAIAVFGFREKCGYIQLLTSVFIGSMLFTIIGLFIATYARTVNQYMLFVTPAAVILTVPAISAVFGVTHPVLDVSPGMALWYAIDNALDTTDNTAARQWPVLFVWLAIAVIPAIRRIPIAMRTEGGESI